MADNYNARLYARGYNGTVSRAPASPPTQPTTCAPACANCGLLECLCRPRFFAGQLLTEQDLNRLDGYIRAKNRMHNLQLHGWGVVNGLQVRCDCGTGVIVGTGYAIDPCGEDILVCGDTPVDVCALIKRCQPVDATCVPSSRVDYKTTCDDVEEDWVLAIRYNETQARAITALRSTPSCACGARGGACTCGGSCGCGSGNKMTSTAQTKSAATKTSQKPRSTPAECEATAICEGYTFDVFPAPDDAVRPNPKQLSGGVLDAMICCIDQFIRIVPTMPAAPGGNFVPKAAAWTTWCCRTKDALIAYFSSGPQADCTLVAKVQRLTCPSLSGSSAAAKAAFEQDMARAFVELVYLLADGLMGCLCAALLPPAPYGTSDDRVPLAIVTVRKKDCSVVRVCNWTHLRKGVLTAPALDYWLGWIPIFHSLQDAIARFCCVDFEIPPGYATPLAPAEELEVAPAAAKKTASDATSDATSDPVLDQATFELNPTLDTQSAADNQTLSTLVMNAVARGNTPLDAKAFISSLFGPAGTKSPLTDTEQANLAPFMLLHQLVRPIVSSLVPADTSFTMPSKVFQPVASDETASLQTRVAALEQAIAAMGKK